MIALCTCDVCFSAFYCAQLDGWIDRSIGHQQTSTATFSIQRSESHQRSSFTHTHKLRLSGSRISIRVKIMPQVNMCLNVSGCIPPAVRLLLIFCFASRRPVRQHAETAHRLMMMMIASSQELSSIILTFFSVRRQ